MFPEKIRPRIACNLEHPRIEATVFTKTLPIFQNSEEHILNQVLRNAPIASKPAKEAEQSLVMPVKEEA
jgi:hypothetical protein